MQTLELLHRNKIKDFDEHSVYTCNDFIYFDGKKTFCAVLLSENLLLNAYRQWRIQDVNIYHDSSFRYMKEGWGIIPVKLMGPGQRMHTVGYGIASQDTEEIHHMVLQILKKEVGRVVNKKIYNENITHI